jgi:hypothetical protein
LTTVAVALLNAVAFADFLFTDAVKKFQKRTPNTGNHAEIPGIARIARLAREAL